MGYLITGGVGLALGLGLLIWAVRLKGKLTAARKAAMESDLHRIDAVRIADKNTAAARATDTMNTRLSNQVVALQMKLKSARERLIKTRDPKTIKAIIDEDLKEEIF